jgi:formamidopyrimidine-DNA glycosylase
MRRGVSCVVGGRIVDVQRPPCNRRPILISPRIDFFRRRCRGKKIESVDRLGKRVVLRLDSRDSIILEPRMTGLVLLADPPTTEHLRLRIVLDQPPCALLYWDRRGLGSVRLMDQATLASLYQNGSLGPDALDVSAAELQSRLAASSRAIKVALLDQRAVAGVGNLYASEILHLAAIHPARRCRSLKHAEWERIHAALRSVLYDAIKYEGSTLSDGTYRNALNQNGGYQHHHRVYDRAGNLCQTCHAASIERIVQAQRSTFFCPKCQSSRRRRAASG